MITNTSRSDKYHIDDTEDNRNHMFCFYGAMADSARRLSHLLECKPLLALLPGIRKYIPQYREKEPERRRTEVWTEEQMEEAYAKQERRWKANTYRKYSQEKDHARELCENNLGAVDEDNRQDMPTYQPTEEELATSTREDEVPPEKVEEILSAQEALLGEPKGEKKTLDLDFDCPLLQQEETLLNPESEDEAVSWRDLSRISRRSDRQLK